MKTGKKAGQNPWISLVDGIYKVLKLISPTVKVKNVESLTQLKNIKEPFFTTILTLSSHEPFEVPMETIIKGDDRQSLYKNSVIYLDRSIENFMKKASTEKYYDNTVFIFISDHGFRVGDVGNRDKERYHIPFFIYGTPLNDKWVGNKISNVGSQSDLPKTILNQLDFNSDAFDFSNDIFINEFFNPNATHEKK